MKSKRRVPGLEGLTARYPHATTGNSVVTTGNPFPPFVPQNSMNLPPDKARLLRQYDNEKKWELICDQVSVALLLPASSIPEQGGYDGDGSAPPPTNCIWGSGPKGPVSDLSV